MEQLTAEHLRLFLVFVVPGFVGSKVYRLLVPGPAPEASSQLLEVVTYSMLNLSLIFWVPLFFWQDRYLLETPALFIGTGFFVLLVSPVLLALFLARARRAKWLLRHVAHPAACAWDFFFEQRRACFVLATLQDGAMVGGYWGPGSFASSSPHSGDLYLEQTWRVVDGSLAEPVPGTVGCHVQLSECRVVEFLIAEEAPDVRKDKDCGDRSAEDGLGREARLPAAVGPTKSGATAG